MPEEDGERIDETRAFHPGALRLFSNYDEHGERLKRPNTLLIDSTQIEAGDTLEGEFRTAAAPEIHMWTAPACEGVEFSFGEMVGCSHMSGPWVRRL